MDMRRKNQSKPWLRNPTPALLATPQASIPPPSGNCIQASMPPSFYRPPHLLAIGLEKPFTHPWWSGWAPRCSSVSVRASRSLSSRWRPLSSFWRPSSISWQSLSSFQAVSISSWRDFAVLGRGGRGDMRWIIQLLATLRATPPRLAIRVATQGPLTAHQSVEPNKNKSANRIHWTFWIAQPTCSGLHSSQYEVRIYRKNL